MRTIASQRPSGLSCALYTIRGKRSGAPNWRPSGSDHRRTLSSPVPVATSRRPSALMPGVRMNPRCPGRRRTTRPRSASTSARKSVSLPTTRRWLPGTKAILEIEPSRTTRKVLRGLSVRASAMLIAPSSCPVAISRPSALTALPDRPAAPSLNGRPSRREPRRSHTKTVPFKDAVYRVRPSRVSRGEKMLPDWPDSVSPAAALRTSQTIVVPSSAVVTSQRPSAVKRAPVTAAAWRPEAGSDRPLRRSRNRTEPSSPPIASVRSSRLSA